MSFFFANIIIILIIDEPKHYQKPATSLKSVYILFKHFSNVAGIIGVKPSNKAYEYCEFIGGAIALEGVFTWSNGIAIIEGVNAANGFKYFKIAVASNSDYLTSNGIYLLESNGVVPDVYFRSDRVVIMNASSKFLFKVTSSVYATISSNVSIEGLNKKSF